MKVPRKQIDLTLRKIEAGYYSSRSGLVTVELIDPGRWRIRVAGRKAGESKTLKEARKMLEEYYKK